MARPLARIPFAYPDRPFHHFLEDAARTFPERTALLFEEESYTFRELDGATNALAHGLTSLGIRPGTRVGLCMSNRPEWILTFFAVSKIGAAVVLLSPAWKETELRHTLELTEPSAVVADGPSRVLLEQLGRPAIAVTPDDDADGWTDFWPLIHSSSGMRDNSLDVELGTWELALPFSSGTTGKPKAVRHSHHTLVAASIQWAAALNMSDSDAIQTYTPMSHILGILNMAAAMAGGARVRLFPRFVLRDVLQSIQDDRITIGIAVAPIALAMVNLPELDSYDLSSLRYFNWSATPVNESIADAFTERTGINWLTAYGATETPFMFANPVLAPHRWRLDSAGLPGSDVQARVVDVVTGDPLPFGETGEIVVRSPGTMLGYLPDEANADAFLAEGWFRTGDIGWIEEEGWLHITDRLKEMIKVSAFQVTPAELESVLLDHPDIADCAVFGIADEAKGQVPHAVVVPRNGRPVDTEHVSQWLADRVATYKQLAAIHVVDQVPRTASGKTLRRQLIDQYSDQAGGDTPTT